MQLFLEIGRYSRLLYEAIRSASEFKTYRKNLFSEMVKTGTDSLGIVSVAGFFTGAVLTIQTSYQFTSALVPKSTIGAITSQSMIIELAAVISGLVLAGRVGARIATELGNMRVSEQIDALESMGFNSVTFLVMPRVMAGILMFPIIYFAAAISGIVGGVLAGLMTGSVTVHEFMEGARLYFFPWDVAFGVIKSFVFGFVITSISCYQGYFASGGAEGVGYATTRATVLSCIYVLLSSFLLAAILL